MSRQRRSGPDAAERIGIALTFVWAVICVLTFVFLPAGDPSSDGAGALQSLMTLIAVLMPVVLIWMAVLAARNLRLIREENRQLRRVVDGMQGAAVEAAESADRDEGQMALFQRVEDLTHAQKKTEAALARLNSVNTQRPTLAQRPVDENPEPSAEPEGDAAQPALALEPPVPVEPPLSKDDFVRAMNFPRDARDKAGFRALRIAMADHTVAGLLRSSEDVLTLLAEDGIYVDDLTPERAHPDVWRKFALGERGGAVSGLGGIRDRESLARTAGRMRQDPVFRDCVHHFLRRFDTMLGRFSEIATDEEMAALADTRSARAFMMLGRISGMFD